MLSDENLRLKGDNEGLRDELEGIARAGVVRRTARNVAAAARRDSELSQVDLESRMGSGKSPRPLYNGNVPDLVQMSILFHRRLWEHVAA